MSTKSRDEYKIKVDEVYDVGDPIVSVLFQLMSHFVGKTVYAQRDGEKGRENLSNCGCVRTAWKALEDHGVSYDYEHKHWHVVREKHDAEVTDHDPS